MLCPKVVYNFFNLKTYKRLLGGGGGWLDRYIKHFSIFHFHETPEAGYYTKQVSFLLFLSFFYFKAQHIFLETRSHVAQDGMKLTAEPPASIHLPRAGSIPFAFHTLSCLHDRLYPQTMSPDRPSLFPATFSQVFCYSH